MPTEGSRRRRPDKAIYTPRAQRVSNVDVSPPDAVNTSGEGNHDYRQPAIDDGVSVEPGTIELRTAAVNTPAGKPASGARRRVGRRSAPSSLLGSAAVLEETPELEDVQSSVTKSHSASSEPKRRSNKRFSDGRCFSSRTVTRSQKSSDDWDVNSTPVQPRGAAVGSSKGGGSDKRKVGHDRVVKIQSRDTRDHRSHVRVSSDYMDRGTSRSKSTEFAKSPKADNEPAHMKTTPLKARPNRKQSGDIEVDAEPLQDAYDETVFHELGLELEPATPIRAPHGALGVFDEALRAQSSTDSGDPEVAGGDRSPPVAAGEFRSRLESAGSGLAGPNASSNFDDQLPSYRRSTEPQPSSRQGVDLSEPDIIAGLSRISVAAPGSYNDGRRPAPGLLTIPLKVVSPAPPFTPPAPPLTSPLPASTRQLFDPHNPLNPLHVAVTEGRRTHRYVSGASVVNAGDSPYSSANAAGSSYSRVTCPAVQGAVTSDVFSSSSNASRISLILGRAAGEVSYIIGTGRILSDWQEIVTIRVHVQSECEELLTTDLRTWMQGNVDQQLWKIFYYGCLESLKMNSEEGCKSLMEDLIADGVSYLTGLTQLLESVYDVPLQVFGTLQHDPAVPHRYTSLVTALAQRLTLCLGDLARYRHLMAHEDGFRRANRYYLHAQRLNPKNGRPYNQLAILATYCHRRLESVYYFCRSLMASNPFQTARESLLGLFHESTKRFMSRVHQPGMIAAPTEERRHRRQMGLRSEVWEHPAHGERSLRTLKEDSAPPDVDPRLLAMSDGEVLKMFVTTFLHVQGKLYTRVNMETFQEEVCVMLNQFAELLSRDPMPLMVNTALHLLAISMFNIANTKLKDDRLGSELRSRYQELSLAVAVEMSSLVLHRCVQLIRQQMTNRASPHRHTTRLFPTPDVETCIVYVKIWADWLLCSASVWNPPPCTNDFRVRGIPDCWTLLAELTNLLRPMDIPSIVIDQVAISGRSVVRLPEDLVMRCFAPLSCIAYDAVYIDSDLCDIELARDLYRVRRVLFVTEEYLCGTEPAPLCLQKQTDGSCVYVSAALENTPSPSAASPTQQLQECDAPCRQLAASPGSLGTAGPDVSATLPQDTSRPGLVRLQQQKLALEKRVRRQEEHHQRLQAVLSETVELVLEVRPRVLVADTNCFVDHLPALESILATHNSFMLAVPIIVLSELDGLTRAGSRGHRPDQSAEHHHHVRRTARLALEFVRRRGQTQVRCVTTRGHMVGSAAYTTEEDDDTQVTNDDKIISCCLNMERNCTERIENGVRYLVREVVLLSDDRNMRIKALSRDLATRTVVDFISWNTLSSS